MKLRDNVKNIQDELTTLANQTLEEALDSFKHLLSSSTETETYHNPSDAKHQEMSKTFTKNNKPHLYLVK